jgi:hypothetical protein
MEKLPGNVISISDYLERKAGPTTEDITKRLAEIALQQLLLASERHRLNAQLELRRNHTE